MEAEFKFLTTDWDSCHIEGRRSMGNNFRGAMGR
jgi:hypothetical protein